MPGLRGRIAGNGIAPVRPWDGNRQQNHGCCSGSSSPGIRAASAPAGSRKRHACTGWILYGCRKIRRQRTTLRPPGFGPGSAGMPQKTCSAGTSGSWRKGAGRTIRLSSWTDQSRKAAQAGTIENFPQKLRPGGVGRLMHAQNASFFHRMGSFLWFRAKRGEKRCAAKQTFCSTSLPIFFLSAAVPDRRCLPSLTAACRRFSRRYLPGGIRSASDPGCPGSPPSAPSACSHDRKALPA